MARAGVGEAAGRGRGAAGALVELAALDDSDLETLKARYPDDWARTGQGLISALEARNAEGAAQFLARANAEAAPWRARLRKSGGNPKVAAGALHPLVRERMARLAVKAAVDGAAAARAGAGNGDPSGSDAPATLRFGRWSGALVQALFFRRGLARKPVSMAWFRALWPLVTQKAALMPLVEPRGIYCFYSQPLLAGLHVLIEEASGAGDAEALEIAAGDGTLSRFLRATGTRIRATDDGSWSHAIQFPEDVERLDAERALARHQPRVVLCSWPPPGNGFEKKVFRTPSVQRYIVLTTRHRFAAGNWPAYDDPGPFERRLDERLSALLLPPEVDPAVIVFDRQA